MYGSMSFTTAGTLRYPGCVSMCHHELREVTGVQVSRPRSWELLSTRIKRMFRTNAAIPAVIAFLIGLSTYYPSHVQAEDVALESGALSSPPLNRTSSPAEVVLESGTSSPPPFNTTSSPAEAVVKSDTNAAFSKEWMDDFGSGDLSCTGPAEYPYDWRPVGYGSNMNYLLLAWTHAILVKGSNDLSVIANTEYLFARTTCDTASNGIETRGGWPCIFAEMPHICAFDSNQDWVSYNQKRGLSLDEQRDANDRKGIAFLYGQREALYTSLGGAGADMMDVLAKLYDYLHSHLQPWFTSDVRAILDEPDIAAVREGNYVGMHIRRGDKKFETKITKTEKYFENVVQYLSSSLSELNATDISGIWLSTDSEVVFDEVKTLAPDYFPNIKPEVVVWVTGRVPVKHVPPRKEYQPESTSSRNTYEALVLLRAEMLMLAEADIFSGTFSSHLGRVVALMRHTLDKPKESALSADEPTRWRPGRKHLLLR